MSSDTIDLLKLSFISIIIMVVLAMLLLHFMSGAGWQWPYTAAV